MLFQTDRLLLREFTEADWPAVLAYQSTPAYQRFYPEVGGTEADARAFVNRFLLWQQEKPQWRYQWAVTLRRQDTLIGNCGIRKSDPDALEAEIGCELAPEHWGRNYPVEMGRLLLRFGFTELGLHRIYAQCIAENRGAVSLAQTLGMSQEGRLRENVNIRGRWHDTLIYSILEQEWKAKVE
ncbi:GNAT family N-acetyltransferase [Microcoleus sp. FACHB-672]|uniref:GNAT family N-acetyltransferase n=1 Tax=Microcoleus sp. FACHB-672 TaxID=2692825 RepID=UPI001689487D|nr:GNAT family protein [Microcoleus sp. FACHB-672]MBD2040400.1 GNAT family N-acetyltransferase [Microcoleus sp. FACHB-672]